ncbi:MAG: hypothetical protein HGA49_01130 [Eubacteriaceae bacterium]|nr:hypothetical protein [Eubacteriaceae bacterium]
MKVALCLSSEDRLESFIEGNKINIYEMDQGKWQLNQHIPYSLEKINSIEDMRYEIKSIADLAKDCRVLIARKISGIFYTVFETAGFDIWEMAGTPKEALDSFSLTDNQEKELKRGKSEIFRDLGEGCYEINLTEGMRKDKNATSKSLLLPFLKNGRFFKINVICSHVPPWFDAKLSEMSLIYKVYETEKGEKLAEICKNICSDIAE